MRKTTCFDRLSTTSVSRDREERVQEKERSNLFDQAYGAHLCLFHSAEGRAVDLWRKESDHAISKEEGRGEDKRKVEDVGDLEGGKEKVQEELLFCRIRRDSENFGDWIFFETSGRRLTVHCQFGSLPVIETFARTLSIAEPRSASLSSAGSANALATFSANAEALQSGSSSMTG